jgi:hypothetical protein
MSFRLVTFGNYSVDSDTIRLSKHSVPKPNNIIVNAAVKLQGPTMGAQS